MDSLISYLRQAMSEEQLLAFVQAVKSDLTLQDRLKGAENLDAVATIAIESDYLVTKVELLKAQAEQTLELSDEELETVAGGTTPIFTVFIILSDLCEVS